MSNQDEIKPHRISSEYDIFEVSFNMTRSGSDELSSAVDGIVIRIERSMRSENVRSVCKGELGRSTAMRSNTGVNRLYRLVSTGVSLEMPRV